MDNYALKFVTNAVMRIPEYDELTETYNVSSETALKSNQRIQRPNPEATVDARPALEIENTETFWFDPEGIGNDSKYIDYDPDGKPDLNTPGTRFDRKIYWRFISDGQLYEYKETITYLKNVYGATTENPWVPSNNVVDEVYAVIVVPTGDGGEVEMLADHQGNVFLVEEFISDLPE